MAMMMKQGLLVGIPCLHSLSPKTPSFKRRIFQLNNKWCGEEEEATALLKRLFIRKKPNKASECVAIDFKLNQILLNSGSVEIQMYQRKIRKQIYRERVHLLRCLFNGFITQLCQENKEADL
ncbi:hypothetical protein HAX54_035313 [Datura stramonium]|uniref:Uncharacterized protein n=1 Tax=Datura stramonium TaxID=4076 RepID=A0ABS8SFA9_DATST|nr:hypothetical protein [Datura stramonium]